MSARLYLVAMEGPPSRWKGGPETMGQWKVADSPEAAMAAARIPGVGWRVTVAVDHGVPRQPTEVTVHERGHGLGVELRAVPDPEYPDSYVRADEYPRGTARISASMATGVSVAEARAVAASILAVCDAVDAGALTWNG